MQLAPEPEPEPEPDAVPEPGGAQGSGGGKAGRGRRKKRKQQAEVARVEREAAEARAEQDVRRKQLEETQKLLKAKEVRGHTQRPAAAPASSVRGKPGRGEPKPGDLIARADCATLSRRACLGGRARAASLQRCASCIRC